MILMALTVPSAAAGRLMANTCRHRTPQSTLTTTFHSPTFNLHAENAATFNNNNLKLSVLLHYLSQFFPIPF